MSRATVRADSDTTPSVEGSRTLDRVQAPRLVATDVDGTLLDPVERVSPRAAAVIERLVSAGVGFVLVTGRPPRWIPPIAAQLGVARLAVCANGGVLYDAADDVVLAARTLEPATLAHVAAVAAEALPGCGLAVERVGPRAFDGAAQFVAEPEYQHAWPSPDNSIVPRAGTLILQRPGREDVRLAPLFRDTFEGFNIVRFARDGRGAVTGFEYHSTGVRRLHFDRVGR